MKSFRILLGITLIGLLFVLSGCPTPNEPTLTDAQKQLKKLSKAWVCTGATLNSSPVTLPAPNASYNYASTFKLTMVAPTSTDATAGPTYTTAGRPTGPKVTPWDASGSFTFGTDALTTLVRNDGVVISYSVTDTQLQMSFTTPSNFNGYDGRIDNVQGSWVFTFGL